MAGIRAFRKKSQAQSPPYKPSNRTNLNFPPHMASLPGLDKKTSLFLHNSIKDGSQVNQAQYNRDESSRFSE
jgi:hypothetical protein